MAVNSVAVSPDGRRILSGSYDQTVKIKDVSSGGLLATFFAAEKDWPVISPNGHCVGSGDMNKFTALVQGNQILPVEQFTKANLRSELTELS